jgi:inosine/xanthosine triphosphatase
MIIQIASTRIPKVNGVQKAAHRLSERFHHPFGTIYFESADISSGVSDTPRSIDEMMRGAQNRAGKIFRRSGDETTLGVGVEGGLFRAGGKIFLQSWSCAFDGSNTYFGSSGAVEIPDALSDTVMEQGADLGSVIDHFAGQSDIRSNQGTFGILTNDSVTREDSFEAATLFALTPLFNRAVYGRKLNTQLTHR